MFIYKVTLNLMWDNAHWRPEILCVRGNRAQLLATFHCSLRRHRQGYTAQKRESEPWSLSFPVGILTTKHIVWCETESLFISEAAEHCRARGRWIRNISWWSNSSPGTPAPHWVQAVFLTMKREKGEAGKGLFHEEVLCPLALSIAFCLICFFFFFFNFIGV